MDNELTPQRRAELEASNAALRRLQEPQQPKLPAPKVSTQTQDRSARNMAAWSKGWRHGYYSPDVPADLSAYDLQEKEAFRLGEMAGYEALEIIELDPRAEKEALKALKTEGRTHIRSAGKESAA